MVKKSGKNREIISKIGENRNFHIVSIDTASALVCHYVDDYCMYEALQPLQANTLTGLTRYRSCNLETYIGS